jgi:hypothetical protein
MKGYHMPLEIPVIDIIKMPIFVSKLFGINLISGKHATWMVFTYATNGMKFAHPNI